jgi:hypothetical protein
LSASAAFFGKAAGVFDPSILILDRQDASLAPGDFLALADSLIPVPGALQFPTSFFLDFPIALSSLGGRYHESFYHMFVLKIKSINYSLLAEKPFPRQDA